MQQLTLPCIGKSSYDLDDFIVSESNRSAYDFVNNWLQNWGVVPFPRCVLLQGSKSSGKTHLAKIWTLLSQGCFVNNLSFLANMNNELNAFVIDDCENWSDNDLLHAINIIHESNKYLLLTTNNIVNNNLLADLRSRLNSILKITIQEPDDSLMQILIFKYFSNRSIRPSNHALQFLLTHLPRQFNQMFSMMDKINNFALTKQKHITVALIQEAIGL